MNQKTKSHVGSASCGRLAIGPSSALTLRNLPERFPLFLTILTLLTSSCMVGPKYQRPPAPVPQAFKEPPPDGWKTAQPSDGVLRGKWWELYNDPELNALEEQVSISNQNVLVAEAQYREAKDAIRVARAASFPDRQRRTRHHQLG